MPTAAQKVKTLAAVSDDLNSKTLLVSHVDAEAAPAVVQDKSKDLASRRNIFYLLGHAPGLFPHLLGVAGSCFDGKTRKLPLPDWHLIVLRAVKTLGAKYDYDVKIPVAEMYEVPQAKIDAMGCSAADVRNGIGPWTARDRHILRIVDEQLANYTNNPQTIKDALKEISSDDLVEILVILSTYAFIAKMIRAFHLDNDAEIAGLKKC